MIQAEDKINPIIIGLKRRKFNLFKPRTWLSLLISIFNGAYTHVALLYKMDGAQVYVSSIDGKESGNMPLINYLNRHAQDREIKYLESIEEVDKNKYIEECRKTYDYDYMNLTLYQPINSIFNKWIGKETVNKVICSEHIARVINNCTGRKVFSNPEKMTPNKIVNSKIFKDYVLEM